MALGRTIARLSVSLGMNTAAFEKGSKRAEGGLGRLKNMLIGPVGITVAVGAAVAGLAKLTMSTIKTADEISKAAQSIGIGTEELSRLRYAADQSNVSFQQLQTGVRIMSRNMVAAAEGSKSQSAAFASLGISVTDAAGRLRSASDVMGDLADRLSKMPDGAQKTAASFAVMGRSGAQMIPMLNGGRDAFIEAMKEADNFGVVIDEVTGKRAEAFQSNMTRLGGVTSKLGQQLAAELLPHLLAFTDWLVKNQKDLVAAGSAVARWGNTLVQVGRSLVNEFRYLWDYAAYLDSRLPWWRGGTGKKLSPPINQNEINMLNDYLNSWGNLADMYPHLYKSNDKLSDSFDAVGAAGNAAGKALADAMRKAAEEARREAEELQRVLERVFPDRRYAREYAEDMERINRITDEGERIAARRALALEHSARAWAESDAEIAGRSLIGGKGGPLDEGVDNTLKRLDDMVKKSQVASVRVVKSMKDMADGTLASLNRMASAIQGGGFLGILEGLIGLGLQLGSIGAFGKNVSTRLNATPRALGGPISAGRPYLVGERGPELVVPNHSGRVIPNNQLGGGLTRVEIVDTTGLFVTRVNGQIMEAAPGIMGGGAAVARAQSARSKKWSLA